MKVMQDIPGFQDVPSVGSPQPSPSRRPSYDGLHEDGETTGRAELQRHVAAQLHRHDVALAAWRVAGCRWVAATSVDELEATGVMSRSLDENIYTTRTFRK